MCAKSVPSAYLFVQEVLVVEFDGVDFLDHVLLEVAVTGERHPVLFQRVGAGGIADVQVMHVGISSRGATSGRNDASIFLGSQ